MTGLRPLLILLLDVAVTFLLFIAGFKACLLLVTPTWWHIVFFVPAGVYVVWRNGVERSELRRRFIVIPFMLVGYLCIQQWAPSEYKLFYLIVLSLPAAVYLDWRNAVARSELRRHSFLIAFSDSFLIAFMLVGYLCVQQWAPSAYKSVYLIVVVIVTCVAYWFLIRIDPCQTHGAAGQSANLK